MDILKRFCHCPVCGSARFEANSAKSLLCGDCGFEYFVNPSSANVAIITNERGQILVTRRKKDPAKGTLDLPGGFADMRETAEEGVKREVMEETGLTVTRAEYLFSKPNSYRYSGIDIPTLDLFYRCEVESTSTLQANDDAAEAFWAYPADIRPEAFGLGSIREGIGQYLKSSTQP